MLDRFNNLYHSFDNMTAFSGALWTRTSNNCNELPSELLEPRGSEGVHVASSLIEYVDKEGRPRSECCVLFVESACVNPKTSEYRAFSKWKQKVSEAVRICRDLNIAGFTETFHDDLVLWVLNIKQNEPARYSQDIMQRIDVNADMNKFKFDGNIGLTTRFPSLPDASAAFCNHLSTREATVNQVSLQESDGLSSDKRSFRWHGKTYTLGLVPSKVVELLHNRYLDGEHFLHEQFIKTVAEVESDMRHIVRDNHLEDLIVRQKKPDGKTANGMWGLSPK